MSCTLCSVWHAFPFMEMYLQGMDAMAEAHMCIGEEEAHRMMTSSVTGHLSLLRHQFMPSCAEIVPP